MRLDATLYRVIRIPLNHLRAAAAFEKIYKSIQSDTKDEIPEFSTDNSQIEEGLRHRFGILAPRFKIFSHIEHDNRLVMGRTSEDDYAYCGMEVIRFSLKDAHRPQAGIVTADPICKEAILMADGALASELERFGIEIETKDIEWRMAYACSGN